MDDEPTPDPISPQESETTKTLRREITAAGAFSALYELQQVVQFAEERIGCWADALSRFNDERIRAAAPFLNQARERLGMVGTDDLEAAISQLKFSKIRDGRQQ